MSDDIPIDGPPVLSETRLYAVLDQLPLFVGILALDGTLLQANRAARAAVGLDPDTLLGEKLWDCAWLRGEEAAQARLRAAIARAGMGVPSREDLEVRLEDDRHGWLDLRIAPVRDESERVTCLTACATDITERKRAEDTLRRTQSQLRQAQERFLAVLKASPVVLFIQDRQLRYTWIHNPALGYEPREVIGTTDYDIFERRVDAERLSAIKQRVLTTGQPAREEVSIWSDGALRWYDLSVQAHHEADEVTGVLCAAVDVTERKRTEEALRRSEQQARMAMNAALAGAWSYDSSTDEAFCDERLRALYGFAPDQPLTFGSWLSRLHPLDRERVRARLKVILETPGQDSWDLEYRVRHPDGSVRWIQGLGRAERDPEQHVVRLSGINLDISARHREEERLHESEQRYRMLTELSPEIVWMADTDGACTYLNQWWFDYTGMSREESLGHGWSQAVDPGQRESIQRSWLNTVAKGLPWNTEIGFRREFDGRYRCHLTRGVPLRDAQGRIIQWLGIALDIHDRKRAESLLVKTATRMQLLWESASVLLTTGTPDAMLDRLFEHIKPELGVDLYITYILSDTGTTLRLVSSAGLPETAREQLKEIALDQTLCGTVALRKEPLVATDIQHAEEPKLQLLRSLGVGAYACHPLMAGGQLFGTLSFATRARDHFDPEELTFLRTISEHVSFAYERMRLIARLTEEDRRKDEFLATLAHELRNPLAPIGVGIEILERAGPEPEVSSRVIAMMKRQLAHQVRLIDDLLDVSRITRGKITLRQEHLELSQLLAAAREMVLTADAVAERRITTVLPPEPLTVTGDRTRLAQVIGNLLNNAVKFTAANGRIWLTAARDGDQARITVRDDGVGIPQEHLEDIFDMFSQAHPSKGGGLGIGLALARALIELHGGRIEARSAGLDQGSELSLLLPLAASASPPPPPNAPMPIPAEVTARRVLVVDDSPDNADSLGMLISALGGEVRVVYDGESALQAFQSHRPQVVLLDLGMPGMDGCEVARRLRARYPQDDILLVAISGWGDEQARRRAAEAGFDHHLVKPASLESLAAVLGASCPLR